MDNKRFTLVNRIIAAVVLAASSLVYLLTIEPTASFWDCGEFIASSYKLEVGHPPGNPVFQLFARFFTMFVSPENAAMAVNAMSAICSGLTIFFLYLTIVHLARRIIVREQNGTYSVASAIAVFGAGVVGAMAYCFSDTFWFSAVEAEVYAMSSLLTAMVFWAMFAWYDQADEPYANRWIVLISLLMGLSIGVHLLNLLTIPALVFIYIYRKRDRITFWQGVKYFVVSVILLAVILYGVIPLLPKLAAYVDLLFVNSFSLPFNTGAVFFMVVLLALCFWGLFRTLRSGKAMANLVLLCFTAITIGFSLFSIVIIRSSANTPTNEYQPDNPFTLIRYLAREQYGSQPLVYGQYFGAPSDEYKVKKYYTPLDGKYVKTDAPAEPVYTSSGKMLFPRMWSWEDRHVNVYLAYMGDRGKTVPGAKYKKPTFMDNLSFFFDYQMNWMYWRYFMWNFAGRQNDLHGEMSGDPFAGNWESGIGFIDRLRLGDQSEGPDYIVDSKAKNHYFMLPLILGIAGLLYQFYRDRRGCWVTFLLFIMTGIAIVIYLNQPPLQVRERDYAYAGSFYAFSIWIGLGVLALYALFNRWIKKRREISAGAAVALSLSVPIIMGCENWDDHDRSNRRTAVEMAANLLESVGENGILITHGDNDTFPLWYAQEVEEIRNDVRIVNTSLLGTDWYIDQMRSKINNSDAIKLTTPRKEYLYGTNDVVYVEDMAGGPVSAKDVMRLFNHPDMKIKLTSGKPVSCIVAKEIVVPVNKENALKYGIVDEKYADLIEDSIVLKIPENDVFITKQDFIIIDLLSNYEWDRPIHMLNLGGTLKLGLRSYLEYNGFTHKLVPIKSSTTYSSDGFYNPDNLYHLVKDVYRWDALKDDYFVDYMNLSTFSGMLPQRQMFVRVADALIEAGEVEKAEEVLDMSFECVPVDKYPLDLTYLRTANELSVLDMISAYLKIGVDEKADRLASAFCTELLESVKLFGKNIANYSASENLGFVRDYYFSVLDLLYTAGHDELADNLQNEFKAILEDLIGSPQ